MTAFSTTSHAALERACDALTKMQAPQLPLFRAVADGLIAAVGIGDPEIQWPEHELANLHLPELVFIGDDLEPERTSTPPSGWRCARMLRAWARTAIVHGAGGEAEHYRTAVAATVLARRLALVETSSACAVPWVEFLKPLPVLVILPRSGSHPVVPSRESIQ